MRTPNVTLALLLIPVAVLGQATTSICDVQEYDSQGLSPLEGQYVSVIGVVTAPPGIFQPMWTYFFIEGTGCGVNVYGFDPLPLSSELGDSVRVGGVVGEYINSGTGAEATTEVVLSSPWGVEVLSTGNPEPAPADMDIASLQVEKNEGRFLRTTGVVVSTNHPWSLEITDGGPPLTIYVGYNENVSLLDFELGDSVQVAGILSQYDYTSPFLDGYELMPRFQSDIWTITPVSERSWGSIKALFR